MSARFVLERPPSATNCHTCAFGGPEGCALGEPDRTPTATTEDRARALSWRAQVDPMRAGVPVEAAGCPSHEAARFVERWLPIGSAAGWFVHGDLFGHPRVPPGKAGSTGSVLEVASAHGRVWTRSSGPSGRVAWILGAPFYTLGITLQAHMGSAWALWLGELASHGYAQARQYHAASTAARLMAPPVSL